jgi:hypothetical protein
MTNWNAVNNKLSQAVLDAGLLGDLLEELGCDLGGRRGGPVYRCPCPVHLGDGANFVVYEGGHTLPVHWECYSQGCHRTLKPSLLGLVRGALAGDPDKPAGLDRACQFVRDVLRKNGKAERPRPSPGRASASAPPSPAASALGWSRTRVRSRLLLPSPYFHLRGFDRRVLDRLDVGDSVKLGRAVAPVYDDDRRLCVGFVSRSRKPACQSCGLHHHPGDGCGSGEPRWSFPAGFRKGDWLYNYGAARCHPFPAVLLVEGVPDVLRAEEARVAAVAPFGVDLSSTQVRKLAALRRRVLVAFDTDEAGRRAAPLVVERLRAEGVSARVYHPPHLFKDVGDMPASVTARWAKKGLVP